MKAIFFIVLVSMALSSCGQSKKKLPTKEVAATDGGKYEYILKPKQDSLRWYNPGQDTFKVTVTFARISAGHPLPDVITDVDDNFFGQEYAPTLKYTPQSFSGDNILNPLGWNFSKGQVFNVAHHNNTLAFLQTDGWVEYTFQGYKIVYYAELFESYGIAGVSIDHGPETMVDLYAPQETNNSSAVFTADSLKNDTTHVIRVRYTRQRNPNANSQAARINLDKFVIYWRQNALYIPAPAPGADAPKPATQLYEQPKKSNDK
jgi:hypothetical protein